MINDVLASAALLTDTQLLEHVQRCAATEREATARLIAALSEVDARRLYLAQGCSSLFTYSTQVLHLSEHAAYGRIEAARVARKFPVVLDLLADGSLHVTAVSLLAPHLTVDNHAGLLAAAKHKSKRDIEQLVAALQPQPPVPSTVRKFRSRTEVRPRSRIWRFGAALTTPMKLQAGVASLWSSITAPNTRRVFAHARPGHTGSPRVHGKANSAGRRQSNRRREVESPDRRHAIGRNEARYANGGGEDSDE